MDNINDNFDEPSNLEIDEDGSKPNPAKDKQAVEGIIDLDHTMLSFSNGVLRSSHAVYDRPQEIINLTKS